MKVRTVLFWSSLALFCFIGSTTLADKSKDQLYDLAWEFLTVYPDSAIYYSHQLRDVAARDNDILRLSKSYYVEGYSYFYKNQFGKAALKYYEGINILNKEGRNTDLFKEREMLFLQNLGLLYELTYGYNEALNYYSQALTIAQSLNLMEDVAVLHYNIGVNYYHLEDFERADANFHKALKHFKEIGKNEEIVETYNLFGVLEMKNSRFNVAKKHFKKAVRLSEKHDILNDKKAWFISNLGENYFLQKEYDSAKYFYNKALNLSQQLSDTDKIKWLNNNLGDVYLREGDYQTAIEYYKTTFAYGNHDEIDEEYKRASKNLAIAYESLDDLESSILYHKQYIHQAELLQSTKNELSEQNAQYRMKEVEWMMQKQLKDQEIHNMEQVNFWFKVSMSLLVLILATAAYKAYRYYTGIKAVKKWLAS